VSEENVELVRRMIAAFESGGNAAASAYCDPGIEYVTVGVLDVNPVYKGYDGMNELTSLWAEQFDSFEQTAEEFVDAGHDRVVVLGSRRGRIKGSQAFVEQPLAVVVETRDGKAIRIRAYFSWHEALKAMGLEE
jgi:ketosteroid isomerase-like protein